VIAFSCKYSWCDFSFFFHFRKKVKHQVKAGKRSTEEMMKEEDE